MSNDYMIFVSEKTRNDLREMKQVHQQTYDGLLKDMIKAFKQR